MPATAPNGGNEDRLMPTETLVRVADAFFTLSLLLMAVLGIVLAWATGNLRELSYALLAVALVAPALYHIREN
jgi:cbb3-type cytochrome oxidase subunit 3